MAKKKTRKEPQGLGFNPGDSIGYGFEGQDNRRERLGKYLAIDPKSSFHDLGDWLESWNRYTSGKVRTDPADQGNAHEEALWKRYLGFERDKQQMPDTAVRFSRDFDEQDRPIGQREYTGLPKEQKDAIREKVIPNMGDELEPGKWVQVEDDVRFSRDSRGTGQALSGLGKFGLRENNGSGIYDVADRYDFPAYIPIPDRNKGQELEIRDTIWTKDAKPEQYKTEKGYLPYNATEKQKEDLQESLKNLNQLKR